MCEKKTFHCIYGESIVNWTTQQEQLLITWAEKASGYAWLHNRSVTLFLNIEIYIFLSPPLSLGILQG